MEVGYVAKLYLRIARCKDIVSLDCKHIVWINISTFMCTGSGSRLLVRTPTVILPSRRRWWTPVAVRLRWRGAIWIVAIRWSWWAIPVPRWLGRIGILRGILSAALWRLKIWLPLGRRRLPVHRLLLLGTCGVSWLFVRILLLEL